MVRINNFLYNILAMQRATESVGLDTLSKTWKKHTHLAEDRFVGFREELGQFFRVTEVQRQPVHAQTLGVQVLLLAQLVHIHPLHHQ